MTHDYENTRTIFLMSPVTFLPTFYCRRDMTHNTAQHYALSIGRKHLRQCVQKNVFKDILPRLTRLKQLRNTFQVTCDKISYIVPQPILEKGPERPGAECVRDGRDFCGQKGRIHLMTNINDTT